MDLNLTLLGQFITFAVFVWFTMKYVWPPITIAMRERKQTIADGLAAAERGKHDLELAQHKATAIIRDAKIEAANIVEETNKRASHIIEEAKERARHESARILELGKAELDREIQKARQELKKHLVLLAIQGAEKIMSHNLDKAANSDLINKLITEI